MKNIGSILLVVFGISSWAFAKDVLLDVRTPEEYSQEHVPQALNVDVKNSNFKQEIGKLSREDHYRIYCRTGKRSAQAISIMKEMGFKQMENLGGLEDAKKVLKVESKTGAVSK
ncbi:MAG: rhodanese-like domain-containing protein [Bacillota bacterium]